MREIIKMIFFWSMFAFGLVVAIGLLIFHIEEKMRNVQKDIDEIYEEKNREEIEAYKRRIEFLEVWGEERAKCYHELLMHYYDILSFEICGKTVEEWEREDRKVYYKDVEKTRNRAKIYRELNKEKIRDKRRLNREKENIKRRERMAEISAKSNAHNKEMGYVNIQRRTRYLINKLGIRPKQCPICGYKTDKVVAHHIDYSKPYEIVFCCSSCHRLIHLGELQIKDEYITTLCESEDGVQIKECEICGAKIKNIAGAKFCNGCREIANREYRERWIEKNKFILNN